MIEMTRAETVDFVAAMGSSITVVVEGHIGSGKSAIGAELAKRFPTHRLEYMDMTVMHEGDFRIPAVNHETKTSEFYYNASLGLHDSAPVILMMDEYGKGSKQVRDASLPLLVERRMGNHKLHPESIVFATTNIGEEGVGDAFQAHHRNRITRVRMGKTPAQQWIDDYAMYNNIAAEIMMWVSERPEVLKPFTDYESPSENTMIFHPKEQRSAFVTHRSLEQASKIVHNRDRMSRNAFEAGLIGTIGAPATADLMAWVEMGDSLPKRSSILSDPSNAQLPEMIAGQMMLAYQALNWVTADTLDPWVTYLMRMPKEMQALFISTIVKKEGKLFATQNAQITNWAIRNTYLFA